MAAYSEETSSNEDATNNVEFLVNTYTDDNQYDPVIATLSDGGFVIAWMSNNQDGDEEGIFAQRYDSAGNVVDDEFMVNTTTASYQVEPSIAALDDGGFVVTWWSPDPDSGDSANIYAQRYNSDGTVSVSENQTSNDSQFQVNTETSGTHPGVAGLSGGGFVITWGSDQIYAQRYNADGSANGNEFQVNTYTSSSQLYPSTTALNDGGFVITWQSSQDGSGNDVYAQRYDADGLANGGDFQVNTHTTSDQYEPSTTALNDGGFVVTWVSDGQDGSGEGIYAQRYNADGTVNGYEFRVNTHSLIEQHIPTVAGLSNGGFVIAWQSDNQDGSRFGIYAQRYNADGSANDDEFLVNTTTTGNQRTPSITALDNGSFVITWAAEEMVGYDTRFLNTNDIYAQAYNSDGEPGFTVVNENDSEGLLVGTSGDDILQGTSNDDAISTGLGADVVNALAGNDTITLTADAVWGAGYSAKNVSSNSSVGTEEKVSLEGLNRFNDVIDGGDDIDTIILTSGSDVFFIDDVYSEHHSSLTLSSTTQGIVSTARMIDLETINAGDGNDIVDLTSDNFVLTNGVSINGEAGNDTLWGSNGNDTIDGGAGNDSLFGGVGQDTLTGGIGSDIFQFTATSSTVMSPDVITDFDLNEDTIKLFYRDTDVHGNSDLYFDNGILTWKLSLSDGMSIDLSATTQSSDLNTIESLITFVEIV